MRLLTAAGVLSPFLALSLLQIPEYACASSGLTESPDKNTLYVGYPRDGTKVGGASTYCVGSTDPARQLLVNGSPVRKNGQGFFATTVPLNRGNNTISLSFADGRGPDKKINVIRPQPTAPVGPDTTTILEDSIEPKLDQGLSIGDLIIFKVRATPGGEVSVKIGNRTVLLSPAPAVRQSRQKKGKAKKSAKKAGKSKAKSAPMKADGTSDGEPKKDKPGSVTSNINEGLAVAYGRVFQSLPADAPDLYVGFYKIQPGDLFSSTPIKFTLKKNGRTATAVGPGSVSVLTQPHIVQTVHDETIVRVSPDKARLTPLPQGVRLMVDGWLGDNMRCIYADKHHVYIKKEDVAYEKDSPRVSGLPTKSLVSTINIMRTAYGDAVVLPMTQRLPFTIEQHVNPNKLTVRIFGAIADTDFVSQQYKPAYEEGMDEPGSMARNPAEPGMVDGVSWKQVNDDTYEVSIKVRGNRQWGFDASYSGTHLLIHVKDPPRIATTAATQTGKSLTGLSVCVDPGHGGAAPGAMGCSGVSEAQVNLAIGLQLKRALEAEGARVVMTRMGDNDLELQERCDMAKAQNVDILMSVHNNSLPDGRDPWREHGSSSYWYHPQATELARVCKDSLVAELGFPDIGCRYQNLALTRPTHQLSLLCEVGFMIHPDEYAQLIKPETHERAAHALVKGLKKYLGAQ